MMKGDNNMKKILHILLPLLLLTLCVALFAACSPSGDGGNTTTKIKIEGITFPDATYDYDGKTYRSISIAGKLPEGVSVTYSGNNVMEHGTYTVWAVFHTANGYEDKYELPEPMSAKLTIRYVDLRETIRNIDFISRSYYYDGEEKFMEIDGILPEGVHANYSGNKNIDVGEYDVTVTFTYDEGYEKIYKPLPAMTAKMTILPASYDLSAVTFEDRTKEYDGQSEPLLLNGKLPDTLKVYYSYIGEDGILHSDRDDDGNPIENFGPTEIGSYTFTVTFESDDPNYSAPAPRSAILEIVPEAAQVTFVEEGFEDVAVRISKGSPFPESKLPTPRSEQRGYTFAWENFDMSAITEDITVRVVKTPIRYTLTFRADTGLTLPEGLPSSYTVEDLPLHLPTVESVSTPYAWQVQGSDMLPISSIPEGTYGNLTLIAVASSETTGLLYEVTDDGVIIKGYEGASSYLFLPETYGGKPIVSIVSGAFEGLPIRYIRLPKTVRNIGNNAFRGCTELDAIDLPSELSNIGNGAFSGCTALTELTLPDALKTIGRGILEGTNLVSIKVPFIGSAANGIISNAYFGYLFGALNHVQNNLYVPESLKTVTISKYCTRIEANAFAGLTSLERVVMESDGSLGVRTISNEAFRGCTSLKEVEIAATVRLIPANTEPSNSPFYGCSEELTLTFHCDKATADKIFGQYFATVAEGKTAKVVYLLG